jgi:pilus assembly protein Flp/PilA
MSKFFGRVRRFIRGDEEGASMVEYGLLVALIAIVAIAAVRLTGAQVAAIFTQIATELTAAM